MKAKQISSKIKPEKIKLLKDYFKKERMIISANIMTGKINDLGDLNEKGKDILYHLFNTFTLYILKNDG